jgi:hypothetical protein
MGHIAGTFPEIMYAFGVKNKSIVFALPYNLYRSRFRNSNAHVVLNPLTTQMWILTPDLLGICYS